MGAQRLQAIDTRTTPLYRQLRWGLVLMSVANNTGDGLGAARANGGTVLFLPRLGRFTIAIQDTKKPSHPGGETTTRKVWTSRVALLCVLGAGFALGVWHHFVAVRSLWVFRDAEPLTSWLIILTGPFSTFPAILLSTFRRSWGAKWLIAGGTSSLCAVVMTEIVNGGRATELVLAAFRYSVIVALPMALLGVSLLSLDRTAADTRRSNQAVR